MSDSKRTYERKNGEGHVIERWEECSMLEWDRLHEMEREIIIGPRGVWFAKLVNLR